MREFATYSEDRIDPIYYIATGNPEKVELFVIKYGMPIPADENELYQFSERILSARPELQDEFMAFHPDLEYISVPCPNCGSKTTKHTNFTCYSCFSAQAIGTPIAVPSETALVSAPIIVPSAKPSQPTRSIGSETALVAAPLAAAQTLPIAAQQVIANNAAISTPTTQIDTTPYGYDDNGNPLPQPQPDNTTTTSDTTVIPTANGFFDKINSLSPTEKGLLGVGTIVLLFAGYHIFLK